MRGSSDIFGGLPSIYNSAKERFPGQFTPDQLPKISSVSRSQDRSEGSEIQTCEIFLDLSLQNINVQKNGHLWKTSLVQEIKNVFELNIERVHIVNPVGLSYGDVILIKFYKDQQNTIAVKSFSNVYQVTDETLVIPIQDIVQDTILAVPVVRHSFNPSLLVQNFRQPTILKNFCLHLSKKNGEPLLHDSVQLFFNVKTQQWQ